MWYPFGFTLFALTTAAILVSVGDDDYYYDEGVYYVQEGDQYTVVAAPVGAEVEVLPSGYEEVSMPPNTYYYYGGTFYELSTAGKYKVVKAPVGAVITHLPEGATEVEVNGEKVLKYNDAYFLPVSLNGEDAFQVVELKK
jgi:hypothetical protein